MDYSKYIQYIENTGGSPQVAWFDDDWEPIGPMVRRDMVQQGLIEISDDNIITIRKD